MKIKQLISPLYGDRRNFSVIKFLLSLCFIAVLAQSLLAEASAMTDTVKSVFPRVPGYWVGDVMPATEGDKLKLYYLFDTDNNGPKLIHPIWSFTTDNFYEYKNNGLFIAPTDDPKSQDYFGIGTGSVIKVGDTYHCFYTGCSLMPDSPTAIMHAVSTDGGKTWDKRLDDTIYPPKGYNVSEFRDSEVMWCEEAGEYWMTVSARTNTNGRENGVVLLYTSSDLSSWTMKGNLFEPNHHFMLECSDIIKLGGKYYLFYSWNCITYYAVSDSIYGPYKDPKDNVLSGNAFTFYAAKAGELNGRHYLCGWLGRKHSKSDDGAYDWAGNLVVYEIRQKDDGTLALDMPETYYDYFNKPYDFVPVKASGEAAQNGNNISLSAAGGPAYVDMGELPKTMLLTCRFTVDSYFTQAGLCFGANGVGGESIYIMLNASSNLAQFDGLTLGEFMQNKGKTGVSASSDRIGSNVFFRFEPGREYTLKVVVEDEIISLYINGEKTLVNRVYAAPGMDWGFFASKNGINFSDIQIFVTEEVTQEPGVSSTKTRIVKKQAAGSRKNENTVEVKPPTDGQNMTADTEPAVTEPQSSVSEAPEKTGSSYKNIISAAALSAGVIAAGCVIWRIVKKRKQS